MLNPAHWSPPTLPTGPTKKFGALEHVPELTYVAPEPFAFAGHTYNLCDTHYKQLMTAQGVSHPRERTKGMRGIIQI